MTDTTLKTKKTFFDGHMYDSQLEAKVAVFFKLGNVEYIPHPTVDNCSYIYSRPDFYLPGEDIYVEVKGGFEGWEKTLKNQISDIVGKNHFKLLVVSREIPWDRSENIWWFPIWYWDSYLDAIVGKRAAFIDSGVGKRLELLRHNCSGEWDILQYPEDVATRTLSGRELYQKYKLNYDDDHEYAFDSIFLNNCFHNARYYDFQKEIQAHNDEVMKQWLSLRRKEEGVI